MPSLSLVVLLSIVIFTMFFLECFANAPIIWPDPRLLRVIGSQNGINNIYIDWPILKYLEPDSFESVKMTVKKVGDENYLEIVENWRVESFIFDAWNTEYIITYTKETNFFPQGVSVDIRFKSDG